MKFQKSQKIIYDPRQVISNRRLKNKSGPFEHQEVKGLRALENLENVEEDLQMTDASNRVQESQGVTVQINPLTMNIQTPAKNDNVNKRSLA